ncbi:MAG TPA: hypothetical protein VFA33_30210 [Bryobacteraceae bacterium]|nr:hypothetical protein [Bryobacteraceae bacterium]
MKRALFIVLLCLAGVYVGDDLSLRFRIPKSREPFGVVEVKRYYAVPLKDHKTEFMPLDAQPQACIQSVFPHFGYSPCWYLRRNRRKPIQM